MPPQERRQAWTVVTGVAVLTAIVLMVTCLNLSNLTLVRAISRLREMSIRTRPRGRPVADRQTSRHREVLLATAGTLGGWVLGVGTTAVVASATEVSLPVGLASDWRMALAVSCAASVATVAIGFAPAWKIGRHDPRSPRAMAASASQGLHGPRLRQWIVAGQIAGSCVWPCGQMLRGLERALDNGQAFAVDRLAVMLALSPESFSSATARTSFRRSRDHRHPAPDGFQSPVHEGRRRTRRCRRCRRPVRTSARSAIKPAIVPVRRGPRTVRSKSSRMSRTSGRTCPSTLRAASRSGTTRRAGSAFARTIIAMAWLGSSG